MTFYGDFVRRVATQELACASSIAARSQNGYQNVEIEVNDVVLLQLLHLQTPFFTDDILPLPSESMFPCRRRSACRLRYRHCWRSCWKNMPRLPVTGRQINSPSALCSVAFLNSFLAIYHYYHRYGDRRRFHLTISCRKTRFETPICRNQIQHRSHPLEKSCDYHVPLGARLGVSSRTLTTEPVRHPSPDLVWQCCCRYLSLPLP